MNIVTGYIPTPEGVAAVDYAIAQAKTSGATLTVVNTGKDGDYSSPVFASGQDLDALAAQLDAEGVAHQSVQPTDGSPAAASILARGGRGGRRPHRDRHPAPVAGREADHRQHGPGRPARGGLPGGGGQAEGLSGGGARA